MKMAILQSGHHIRKWFYLNDPHRKVGIFCQLFPKHSWRLWTFFKCFFQNVQLFGFYRGPRTSSSPIGTHQGLIINLGIETFVINSFITFNWVRRKFRQFVAAFASNFRETTYFGKWFIIKSWRRFFFFSSYYCTFATIMNAICGRQKKSKLSTKKATNLFVIRM